MDAVAVVAVASGIIAAVPVAAVTGIVALARTRQGRRRGRGLAVTGLLLTGVWLVAGALVLALLLRPAPLPRDPHPLRGTIFALRTGDCANTARNGVSAAHVVPCRQLHQDEIYGTFRMAGTRWPGTTALAKVARLGCASRLAGYLDPQIAPAGLTETYIFPDQGAWQAGARTVVCEIRGTAGPLTGSVRKLTG